MKISELIEKLEKLRVEQGDIEVYFISEGDYYELEDFDVRAPGEHTPPSWSEDKANSVLIG